MARLDSRVGGFCRTPNPPLQTTTQAIAATRKIAKDTAAQIVITFRIMPLSPGIGKSVRLSIDGSTKAEHVKIGDCARAASFIRRVAIPLSLSSALYNREMPELPEVETIARGVDARVRGDRIAEVWLGRHREPFKTPTAV